MLIETPSRLNYPVHFETPTNRWMDRIDCDMIPECGTFFFVDQLLNKKSTDSKQIQFAYKLLQPNDSVNLSIHTPRKASAKSFVETMILEATATCSENMFSPIVYYARNLKLCVEKLQVNLNQIIYQEFVKYWQEFTRLMLQQKAKVLLA